MSTRKKVLVLNTHAEFLIALQRVLEEEGFDTTTTWDTQEVLALLVSREFDVVLLGEHPPEMNSPRY